MQKWLQQELADMAKAVELRTKEASELVADYTSAKINPKEAERRFCEYGERWGEVLPGTHAVKGVTDAQILAEIDETRRPDFKERFSERIERMFRERDADSPGKAR